MEHRAVDTTGGAVAAEPPISGSCDERFVAVRRAFENNFAEHGELGAAVNVTIGGGTVVDLQGGWRDPDRKARWTADTLVCVYSVGKAMAALCLLALVERGQVDLDEPVASHWPAFAARGKGAITPRMLLDHSAGLPGIREPLPGGVTYDWQAMTTALANERPWWEPGTKHGYHVNSFGFLIGELVRRISGDDLNGFFQREFARPLGVDFAWGIGPEQDQRTAHYIFSSDSYDELAGRATAEQREMFERVYFNPPGISGVGTVNERGWRAAQIPSSNGHATAAAVARLYTALAQGGELDGTRVIDPATIERARAEQSSGIDAVLGRPSRFGLGFQLTQPERPMGPNPNSFGHFGAGGSLGFADPDERLAFGYVMNSSGPRWQNPRNQALVDAVYASL